MTGRMDWEDGAILPDNSLRLQRTGVTTKKGPKPLDDDRTVLK